MCLNMWIRTDLHEIKQRIPKMYMFNDEIRRMCRVFLGRVCVCVCVYQQGWLVGCVLWKVSWLHIRQLYRPPVQNCSLCTAANLKATDMYEYMMIKKKKKSHRTNCIFITYVL